MNSDLPCTVWKKRILLSLEKKKIVKTTCTTILYYLNKLFHVINVSVNFSNYQNFHTVVLSVQRKNVISLVTVEKYFVKTIYIIVVCNLVLNQLISRIFATIWQQNCVKSVQLGTFKIYLPYFHGKMNFFFLFSVK